MILLRCVSEGLIDKVSIGSGNCWYRTGTRPTDDISIDFEIQLNLVMLLFITYLASHNEIWRTLQ